MKADRQLTRTTKIDTIGILASFTTGVIRAVSNATGKPVQTVNEAMQAAKLSLPKHVINRTRKLDLACVVSRHVTAAYCDQLLSDIQASLPVVHNVPVDAGKPNDPSQLSFAESFRRSLVGRKAEGQDKLNVIYAEVMALSEVVKDTVSRTKQLIYETDSASERLEMQISAAFSSAAPVSKVVDNHHHVSDYDAGRGRGGSTTVFEIASIAGNDLDTIDLCDWVTPTAGPKSPDDSDVTNMDNETLAVKDPSHVVVADVCSPLGDPSVLSSLSAVSRPGSSCPADVPSMLPTPGEESTRSVAVTQVVNGFDVNPQGMLVSAPASADVTLQAWRVQMADMASSIADSMKLSDVISARIAESAALGAQTD